MAIKGQPTVNLTNQSTALFAPAGKHSEKPAEFYELVEGLCPGAKLDVFARARRDGWESYGHEVQPQPAGVELRGAGELAAMRQESSEAA